MTYPAKRPGLEGCVVNYPTKHAKGHENTAKILGN
jgi:hypothetical protein